MREDNFFRAEGVMHLLQRAMTNVGSDRRLALRCLQDASELLGAEETCATGPASKVQGGGLAWWQVRQARAYIEENLGEDLSVHGLAAVLSLSASHFSRSFKRSLGLSPMAYIARRRVTRAQHMLISTGEALTQIALACGFSDQSHFSRLFRRTVGVSPGQWRRMNPPAVLTEPRSTPAGVGDHV